MTTDSASINTSEIKSTRHHAHHYKDAKHEFDSSILGVWAFLATEVLMFGGLFVAYAIFSNMYPETFLEGSKYLDWKMGATNTVVLLFSSLTVALSIYYAKKNNTKMIMLNLGITILCGAIFMCIKYMEYSHKIHEGLLPGNMFSYVGAESPNLALYFSVYYCMTGLHGLHVIIGMGLITWVLIRASKGEFNEKYYTPIEGVGLFWHLIDLIWIFLFPLLYLI